MKKNPSAAYKIAKLTVRAKSFESGPAAKASRRPLIAAAFAIVRPVMPPMSQSLTFPTVPASSP